MVSHLLGGAAFGSEMLNPWEHRDEHQVPSREGAGSAGRSFNPKS